MNLASKQHGPCLIIRIRSPPIVSKKLLKLIPKSVGDGVRHVQRKMYAGAIEVYLAARTCTDRDL